MPNKYKYIILILLAIMLNACSKNMDDLIDYVNQIKARRNPQVDPIPSFAIIPNHFYEVSHLRDPFKPIEETKTGRDTQMMSIDARADGRQCERPDPYRIRVGLEQVPLDALRMVGTMNDDNNNLWGLVTSRDGITYRVQVGDYMGLNDGLVIDISETKIELRELYPDDSGCFSEQLSSIVLPTAK